MQYLTIILIIFLVGWSLKYIPFKYLDLLLSYTRPGYVCTTNKRLSCSTQVTFLAQAAAGLPTDIMNGYSYILRDRRSIAQSRWRMGATLCVLSVFVLWLPLAAGTLVDCSVCSCSGTPVHTVDCSNQDLTEVPSGIPASTTSLYVFVSWDKWFSLTATHCFLCNDICRFLV
jgi:hypothetical protein